MTEVSREKVLFQCGQSVTFALIRPGFQPSDRAGTHLGLRPRLVWNGSLGLIPQGWYERGLLALIS